MTTARKRSEHCAELAADRIADCAEHAPNSTTSVRRSRRRRHAGVADLIEPDDPADPIARQFIPDLRRADGHA